jgi:hypothetical protein
MKMIKGGILMRPKAPTQFIAAVILAACGLLLLSPAPVNAQADPTPPALPAPPAIAAMSSAPMMIAPPVPAFRAAPAIPGPPTAPAPLVRPAPASRFHPVPARPTLPPQAAPEAPQAPEAPEAPPASAEPSAELLSSSVIYLESESNAAHQHRTHHNGPAADCPDLHIQFEGEPGIMDSEQRTLTKSEAAALHVDELENGGIQMRGWDKDTYSVTACKFADPDRQNAKDLLSQIQLSTTGGHVSVRGPGHEHEWTVYLLIRTPRGATIDVKSHNGPLSFYEVDGEITARGTNGPISMADCSGEADISAENGPVSFSGKAGKLRFHTQNGPISIALQDSDWSNGSLQADAVNGPLSLSVASGFRSSFVLESKGHSPMSCHASICDDARKTWDDDHRRIEYGSGTPVIRLSTENGPVTVSSL